MKQSLRWLAAGAAGFTLLAGGVAAGASGGLNDGSGLGADSTTPLTSFVSGADGGTKATISDHGNVINFESPAGFDHLLGGTNLEGYVLCYTPAGGAPTAATDLSDWSEIGFGAPTSTSTSPTGAVIVRETTDGVLRLRQQFVFRGVEKRLFIQNTIKNLTSGTVSDITFRRVADFDIDVAGSAAWASFSDNWFSRTTRDSVTAWNLPEDAATAGSEAHALTLRAMRGGQDRAANALDGTAFDGCTATSVATPVQMDGLGSIDFDLGGLPPGQAKSVKVDYVRG